MSLCVSQIAVDGFDKNLSYIIYDSATKEAAIVDPSGDIDRVFSAVSQADLTVTTILLTHTHFDHIERLHEALAEYPEAHIYVHELGYEKLEQPSSYPIHDCESIPLGQGEVAVLHTPGHIDDAVCFYIPEGQAADGVPKLISGDTLFVEGCGKTTEASVERLYQSLQRIAALPPETVVYPGHDYGPQSTSTIAHEREHNRFLLASDSDAFTRERLG